MHMADALLSPAVGGTFYLLSGAGLALSAKKFRDEGDQSKVPLMGVLAAFVFAAQMINFSIPGTGSSGHIGGGMLLAMLLGPWAGFIALSSVLVIQALFFADGGLLALGCNIWNMGFYGCIFGWLIYRGAAGKNPSRTRISIAAVLGPMIALELGAFTVVIQTLASGISELPFDKFTALMLGIHFPIAIVEGLVTMAVINFVYQLRAELVKKSLGLGEKTLETKLSYRPVLIALLLLALLTGGALSWFASAHPDGLEWSISKTYGQEELSNSGAGIYGILSKIQKKTAILPDYSFKSSEAETAAPESEASEENWPAISKGASFSGILGSGFVLGLVLVAGMVMLRLRGDKKPG